MPSIVDYKVFADYNPEDLSIQVANKLIAGWRLYKGPFSAFDENKDVSGDRIPLVCQAMVIYEKAQRPHWEEASLVYSGQTLDFYEVTEPSKENLCVHFHDTSRGIECTARNCPCDLYEEEKL